MKKRTAVIGYGALGKIAASGIREVLQEQYEVTGVFEVNPKSFSEIEKDGFYRYSSFNALLEDKPDFVVEMAGDQAVREYGVSVLSKGIKLVIASVGALADDILYQTLWETAELHHTKLYLISGAIGGFDVFQTIKIMGNAKGKIENFKAPASLNGAPYLGGCTLPEDQNSQVFSGTAREAIGGFPKNVNVAVASAIASVGVDEMNVEIESIPGLKDNIHKVTIENLEVKAVVEIASKPDPKNPKSSAMAAWSAVALLKNLASPIELF